jgi:hypothetical protein
LDFLGVRSHANVINSAHDRRGLGFGLRVSAVPISRGSVISILLFVTVALPTTAVLAASRVTCASCASRGSSR